MTVMIGRGSSGLKTTQHFKLTLDRLEERDQDALRGETAVYGGVRHEVRLPLDEFTMTYRGHLVGV